MNSTKYKSLFDIIGPVMIGPSSSHTAGAVRIGNMARAIFDDRPDSVNLYLFGSFAETYKGHGTDIALVGGLLGMKTDDVQLQESLLITQEIGMTVNFIPLADEVDHPNTVRLVMRKDQKKVSVTGVSIGGGNALIIEIDGQDVEIRDSVPTIVIYHYDKPGVIALVSTLLSKKEINISSMKVWRQQRGKEATMIIEVDGLNEKDDLNILRSSPDIRDFFMIGCE